jgi:hypothetical protein
MNKIILLGLRDLYTDEQIKAQRDYAVFLIAQRISEEKVDSNSDKAAALKYRLQIIELSGLTDIGAGKDIVATKQMSKSQKQRWLIEQEIGRDDYEPFMDWLFGKIPNLIEDYKENL